MSEEKALTNRLKALYEICASHHDNTDSQESLPLSQEGLLDGFLALHEECSHDNLARNKHVAVFTKKYENAVIEANKLMVKATDFEVKDVIGRGHFGVVQVVKEKKLETVYAMKVLRKNDILSQPEISFYQEERDIMASATSSWITHLHYAFQDTSNLYLVMDFHPGGDLLSLLSRHDDLLEEDMARFYLAEMAIAINDLHGMGYVHRDIKPENILLDQQGHIKLADFGSAAKMSTDKMVSSRMPVGTPDYVAPELLTSMNTTRGPRTYSVEVDWWSLGVCAYEMMYGKTPFTDEYGSMVTTYSNIMNFKSKLQFPKDSNVSETARDLIRNLLSDQQSRYSWTDIRKHKFFSSTNWELINKETPPFIPTVSSLDDTSNFEEVEKVKAQASLDDFKVHKDFSGRDLPFVGFTFIRDIKNLCYCSCHEGKHFTKSVPSAFDSSKSDSMLSQSGQETNVEVTLTVTIDEIRCLKERCGELEESEFQLKTEVDKWKRACQDKEEKWAWKENTSDKLHKDVDIYIDKIKTLNEKLTSEREERQALEQQAEQMYLKIANMTQEAQCIQEELMLAQIDDLRDIISQLEMESENLQRRLRQKDRQMQATTNSLTDTQKQLTHLQLRLDKERRKSREDQRQELVMLENRDEVWKQQVEEKQAVIDKLNTNIRDLEDLVEAYEQQDKDRADDIDQLHNKLDVSLRETTGLVPFVKKSQESSKGKVEVYVTLKSKRPSILNNSYLEGKIKDLEELVDHYSGEAKSWKQREDSMKKTIQKLQMQASRKDSDEARMQKKEDLFGHLRLYQQEVHDQKKLIKDLQSTMKSCLDERQKKSGELRMKVQALEEEKSGLEHELEKEQEVSEEYRALMDKQNKEMEELSALVSELQVEVEDFERERMEIKEEYSARFDTSVQKLTSEKENLEKKITSLEMESGTLQSRIDELSEQLASSENRVSDLNSQVQQLSKQKSDLQVRMESLQRKSASNDENLKVKAELNSQINTLQQEKSSVESRVTRLLEEKETLERKLTSSDKERENLKSKVKKLENLELEKINLEQKVSRLGRLESDKQDLEKKVEDMRNISREKHDLEVKLARLERAQKEKERLEGQLQEVEKDKRELERKINKLERKEKDLNETASKLEEDNKSLEKKISRLEKIEEEKIKLQEKVISMQRLEVEVQDLKNRLKTLEGVEQEKSEVLAKVEKSKTENESLVDKLRSEKRDLEFEIRSLRGIKEEKKGLQDEVSRLKALESDAQQLRSKLRTMERTEKEVENKMSTLKREKELEKEKLEMDKKDLESRVKKLEKVKLEFEKLEVEKRELDVKILRLERLETEKKDVEVKLKNLEKGKYDVQKSEEERRKLEGKVALLEKVEVEKKNLEEKYKKLEKEKQELEDSEKEKKDLEIKIKCFLNLETEKKDLEEKVTRLARLESENKHLSEKLKNVESEKDALAVKVRDLEKKVGDKSTDNRRSLVDRLQSEKSDLQRKVENLEKEKDEINRSALKRTTSLHDSDLRRAKNDLEDKVRRLEKVTSDLEQELNRNKEQINNMNEQKKEKQTLQDKLETLMKENSDLKVSLEKSKSRIDVGTRSGNDNQESEVNELEKVRNSLKRTKSFAAPKEKEVGDLEQDKRYLEAKVTSLQKQLDQRSAAGVRTGVEKSELENLKQEKMELEGRVKQLTSGTLTLQKELETLLEQTEGVDALRDENDKFQAEVNILKQKLAAQEQTKVATNNKVVKTDASTLEDVRRELNESNLALSEARSLLSAAQRQEQELKEQIHQMQRQLDNYAMERGATRNEASQTDGTFQQVQRDKTDDKEDQLKLLTSKYEMFSRQNKTLEEKLVKLQKEKSLGNLEHSKVLAQINDKNRQIDLEAKKAEKYRTVCKELEEQVKDMEALVAEYEKREAEWNKIRKTYEQVVDEREEELEGTSQKLSAIQQARSVSDDRVNKLKQQLKSAQAAHKGEVEALNHKLWEERSKAQKANSKMSSASEKADKTELVLSQQKVIIDAHESDKIKLKEEISKILTENQELRGNNLQLKKNLDEAMDKFELIFGEKIDLENFAEAMQGLHFLEKYKFESTIGQQMKLIDYLQELWHDSMSKKKRSGKLFGSMKSKDVPAAIVPQWKDFQASLEAERKRNSKLQDQVDRLRQENFQLSNELLKLKGPLREKTIFEGTNTLTPKVKAAVAALAYSPASQPDPAAMLPDSPTYVMSTPTTPQPKQQRMHHNIPHLFVNGLNTRATKCALCLGSVHFVKQAAKCQECHIVCHPRCVSLVPASCGLPTEYVRHYTDMMEKVNKVPVPFGKDEDANNIIQMEGWMKLPRSTKTGWEKRYVTLDGTWLMVYEHQNDASPVDTMELNPQDAEVSVHSAVTSAELSSTASTDLPYVLRIDHDPVTTCWPGRVMYLMAPTFAEKQRWVASLEAAVKSAKKGEAFRKSLVLLGAEEGLFAVNPQSPVTSDKILIPVTGISNIHQMALASGLGMILMITGADRRLIMVEKKLIKLRLGQCSGGETAPLPVKYIEGVVGCTVFDVGMWQDSTYLCIGMTDRVLLMKYNPSLGIFCTRKEFDSYEPCSCVCIAESFALVGTEKFYRISLEHPSMLDFVDKQDSSLAFAAFGAANHHSYPLAVVQVSPGGLPLEFLLCFHEFGVFVDERGRRSRPLDVKWSGLPLTFVYREPFLYITYFNCVQATVVPASKQEVKGRQTLMDLQSPRYLGAGISPGTVFILANTNSAIEMLCVRGLEEHDLVSEDKENRRVESLRSCDKMQVRFVSPQKDGQSRRRLSLTSVDSSSSETYSSS